MAIIRAGQARNGVDHQQRRMLRGIDGGAHAADREVTPVEVSLCTTHTALMRCLRIRPQTRFDQVGLRRRAASSGRGESARRCLRKPPVPRSTGRSRVAILRPQRCEVSGLVHQHVVAGAQGVAQSRFPCARARGRIDDHRDVGLEDLLQARQYLQTQRAEFRAAMIDGGQAHGPQDAVGHRAGARDLQEMLTHGVRIEFHGSTRTTMCPTFCSMEIG